MFASKEEHLTENPINENKQLAENTYEFSKYEAHPASRTVKILLTVITLLSICLGVATVGWIHNVQQIPEPEALLPEPEASLQHDLPWYTATGSNSFIPCGTCESEHSRLWDIVNMEGTTTPWTIPRNMDEWTQYYSYHVPEAYTDYKHDREQCKWEDLGLLGEHNPREIIQQTGHPIEEWKQKAWQTKEATKFDYGRVSHCKFPAQEVRPGVHQQKTILRIEGFEMEDMEMRQGYVTLPLPEGLGNNDEAYVIESLDSVFDSKGKSMDYPPLHSHHGSSMMRKGLSDNDHLGLTMNHWGQKFTQRQVDHCGCGDENIPNQNQCMHFRHPDDSGWPIMVGSKFRRTGRAFQQSWMYNQVAPMEDYMLHNISLEFMRVFEWGASLERDPVWSWDLQISGNGAKFHPIAGAPGSDVLSIAWHIYEFPMDITFKTGFMHTHAAVASEMFLFTGNIEEALPNSLVSSCYEQKCCQRGGQNSHGTAQEESRNGFGTYYSSADCTKDMIMGRTERAAGVLQAIINKVEKIDSIELMCQFKSRNYMNDDGVFTRSHLISKKTLPKCEGWTVHQGSQISLLAWHYPPTESPFDRDPLESQHQQHTRWFASAQFDIEKAKEIE